MGGASFCLRYDEAMDLDLTVGNKVTTGGTRDRAFLIDYTASVAAGGSGERLLLTPPAGHVDTMKVFYPINVGAWSDLVIHAGDGHL